MKKAVKALPRFMAGLLIGAAEGVLLLLMINRIPDLSAGAEFGLYYAAIALDYALYVVETILHEAGHLIFGLLTGWRFVSFRVRSAIWIRGADGSIRRGRLTVPGTAGQCLLAPPPGRKDDYPYQLYNMGGVIMNLLTAVIFGLLTAVFWNRPLAALVLMEVALVGLRMALVNGLPLRGPVNNDGRNHYFLRQSADARRALRIELSAAAAEAEGKCLREMPDKWFKPFPEAAMDNPLIASIAVLAAERKLDAFDLAGAEADIRALLARDEGLTMLSKAALTIDGAFCELVGGHPGDLCEALGSPAYRRILKSMRRSLSLLRTRYAEALLKNNDEALAQEYLEAFEEAAEDYPYPQNIEFERQAMALAREAKNP